MKLYLIPAICCLVLSACSPKNVSVFDKAPASVKTAVAKYTVIVSYNTDTNSGPTSKKYFVSAKPIVTSAGVEFHDANGKLVLASNFVVIEN